MGERWLRAIPTPPATAAPMPAAPPLPEHEGLTVRWGAWDPAPRVTHLDLSCDLCHYTGQPLMAWGVVEPPASPVFTRPGTSARRRAQAWRRLVAYRCPSCADLWVYDFGGGPDGKTFTEVASSAGVQLDLFPDMPAPAAPARPLRSRRRR